MKLFLTCLSCLLAVVTLSGGALAQSQQIRINKDTCAVYSELLKKQIANPLYAKAVATKKGGHPLPMQQERLDQVSSTKSLLQALHCK
jgi:hypothetical protein